MNCIFHKLNKVFVLGKSANLVDNLKTPCVSHLIYLVWYIFKGFQILPLNYISSELYVYVYVCVCMYVIETHNMEIYPMKLVSVQYSLLTICRLLAADLKNLLIMQETTLLTPGNVHSMFCIYDFDYSS